VAKVFILYERERDPERYAAHVRRVCGQGARRDLSARAGLGNPFGEPEFGYYAEFEFADKCPCEDQNPCKFQKPTPGLEPGTPSLRS
jgi:hypothetical protein